MSPETKTYRGASLEEIIPRIREELGPDAVITRRREGLTGGVAGFFQKQFVEVEAQAGDAALPERPAQDPAGEGRFGRPRGRLVDAYDDAAREEGMRSPAIRALMEQAAPFADQLDAAERKPTPYETAVADAGDGIERELAATGLSPALAAALVSSTVSHLLPFAPHQDLRRLVRSAIARRIPTQPGWGGRGRKLAFVGAAGSGKTASAARLAAAYAAGEVPAVCIALRPADGGADLRAMLEGTGVDVLVVDTAGKARALLDAAGEDTVVVIDTPAVSPQDLEAVDRLADELDAIHPYEVHLTLPASTAAGAARELLGELDELGVSRIALTSVDSSRHLGTAVGIAIASGRPISYIGMGAGTEGRLEPADSYGLAGLLLP